MFSKGFVRRELFARVKCMANVEREGREEKQSIFLNTLKNKSRALRNIGINTCKFP